MKIRNFSNFTCLVGPQISNLRDCLKGRLYEQKIKSEIFQIFSFASADYMFICGLYYNHITIINYDSSIVNKFGASLTDDARVIIYDRLMFYSKGH